MTWNELSNALSQIECADDELFAFITDTGKLLMVCEMDQFPGYDRPFRAIALPWEGSGEDLEELCQ